MLLLACALGVRGQTPEGEELRRRTQQEERERQLSGDIRN
jgi:hypothetical protein